MRRQRRELLVVINFLHCVFLSQLALSKIVNGVSLVKYGSVCLKYKHFCFAHLLEILRENLHPT